MAGIFRTGTSSSTKNTTKTYLLIFWIVPGCIGYTDRISVFQPKNEFRTGIFLACNFDSLKFLLFFYCCSIFFFFFFSLSSLLVLFFFSFSSLSLSLLCQNTFKFEWVQWRRNYSVHQVNHVIYPPF